MVWGSRKMIKPITIFKTFPYLLAAGAIVLFSIGYISHALFGHENPVEELAEEILQDKYNIHVEFSGEKK